MKKICYVATIAVLHFLSGCLTTPVATARPVDIRAMTFNIRNGRAKDGNNSWDLRKEFVCDVIRDDGSDVIGLQEAFRFQLDEFRTELTEYGEVGEGRDGRTRGEYSAILYLKKRFTVSASGTFWLSKTPSKPSRDWGSACTRVCTWARLMDRESTQSFYVYNTHLDHRSQSARENGIKLIMKRVAGRTYKDPFILMGDLNAGEDNKAIVYLKRKGEQEEKTPIRLVDSFRVLNPDEKVVGTFNGFTGRSDGPKIDYILVTPETRVLEAAIVKVNRYGRYPSDHYPVTARLSLRQSPTATLETHAEQSPAGDALEAAPEEQH